MAPRVLVIDDEPQIRRALRVVLRANGFHVDQAVSGEAGLDAVAARVPELVILDLALPDLDGVEVCRRIREWSDVPVIVLSVHGDEEVKVRALDEGADDYLTKPFSTPELLARIRVALRRTRGGTDSGQGVVHFGNVTIDFARRVVTRAGEEVHLTPTEYELIRNLSLHPGRVITHGQLLRAVLGPGAEDATGSLRFHMVGLRKKLEEDPSQPRFILTEPGVGYRLRTE